MCRHGTDAAEAVVWYYRWVKGVAPDHRDRGLTRCVIPDRCRFCEECEA
jgi:hypothetical protein